MSLEHQAMRIASITHHVAARTIELIFESVEFPTRPDWVLPDHWWEKNAEQISVTVPVGRKLTTTKPWAIGLIGQDAEAENIYVRYEWDGTTWVAGPRVDPNTAEPI